MDTQSWPMGPGLTMRMRPRVFPILYGEFAKIKG